MNAEPEPDGGRPGAGAALQVTGPAQQPGTAGPDRRRADGQRAVVRHRRITAAAGSQRLGAGAAARHRPRPGLPEADRRQAFLSYRRLGSPGQTAGAGPGGRDVPRPGRGDVRHPPAVGEPGRGLAMALPLPATTRPER